jgi:hypothetical protein
VTGWVRDRHGRVHWLSGEGEARPHIGQDMRGTPLVGSPVGEAWLRVNHGPLVPITEP